MIADLVARAIVIDGLVAVEKTAALQEILAAAAQEKLIAKKLMPGLLDRLVAREALGSTGIGNGVAIPHVKADDIKSMSMVVARSVAGIDYQAIDGRPVHTVFLLLAPASEAQAHLAALKWISGLARSGDFRRFFQAAKDVPEIRDLLSEMLPKR